MPLLPPPPSPLLLLHHLVSLCFTCCSCAPHFFLSFFFCFPPAVFFPACCSLGSDPGSPKKCRARFGLNQQTDWCGPCRWVPEHPPTSPSPQASHLSSEHASLHLLLPLTASSATLTFLMGRNASEGADRLPSRNACLACRLSLTFRSACMQAAVF